MVAWVGECYDLEELASGLLGWRCRVGNEVGGIGCVVCVSVVIGMA